ncbi:MAG: Plug domain-containing protein, partial [Saprospiraceae bacterium]|nr:Plug domain-containing protein [Saprospiraceae bacterium]
AFKVPLIEQDKTSGGQTLTSDQIKNLPTRSVNAIVATTAGTTSIDGGAVNIKGSRSNATNYYIDGIRVTGSLPPVQD